MKRSVAGTMGSAGAHSTGSAALPAILILPAVLLAAGCSGKSAESAEKSGPGEVPRNVRVLEIERTDLTEYLELTGVLEPVRGADISTEEGGVVASVPHDKGAVVEKGWSLVVLDRGILKAEMDAAQAELTLRRFNEEKTKALYDDDSVSGQEMLLVHTQHEEAKAKAEVARLRFERAAVGAPFSGIVADRFVELGELVQPGALVVRIVDPFTLKLSAAATEADVAWIEKGSAARIGIEGVEENVAGAVHWVGFEADPRTGKFQVEILVENPKLRIRPGMLGRARVEKRSHEDVVAIPRDAVVQAPGREIVFVEEDGRARRRDVKLGSDEGLLVVALSGLAEGDRLIVRGQRDLTDGVKVIVQETADSRDGTIRSDPEGTGQAAETADEKTGRLEVEERGP